MLMLYMILPIPQPLFKMTEIFTQKEMLIRVLDKLGSMEIKLNETHEKSFATNGKVRLHTKLIFLLFGIFVTCLGLMIKGGF